MRWPFRRLAGPEPEVPGPGEPAARPSGEWRQLPAVGVLSPQAIAGSHGLVRPRRSRWQQPPVLGQLGHDVTAQAPGGLVSGLARSVGMPSERHATLVPGPGPGSASPLTWPPAPVSRLSRNGQLAGPGPGPALGGDRGAWPGAVADDARRMAANTIPPPLAAAGAGDAPPARAAGPAGVGAP